MHVCWGRTPLHCAASSNNIEAVQLLIEHGAGVLAFTWDTERETPLDKCCPDSPGFEGCYQFITGAGCICMYGKDILDGYRVNVVLL